MIGWVTAAEPVQAILSFLAGYLLGSIPFGVVFTRAAGLGDIRQVGSGNIGATNVLRTGRKGLAAATLLADAGKGALAVLAARYFAGEAAAFYAGLGAFLGHLFPLYLGFAGGKGVATYIGVLAGLFWPAAVIFCGIWVIVAVLSRYSSLSALTGAAAAPIVLFIMGKPDVAFFAGLLSALLIARHHRNIRNLLSGQESRIGERAGK